MARSGDIARMNYGCSIKYDYGEFDIISKTWRVSDGPRMVTKKRLYREVVTKKQTLSRSGYWETDFIKKWLLRNRLYHEEVTKKQTLSWSGY
jgi:hypothetical protein